MVKKKRTKWDITRKLLNDIHLWIGLASGLIVLLVCFSGTIYVFNTEIREAANPELFKIIEVKHTRLTPEGLALKVEQASLGKVVAMKIPANPQHTWQFSVRKKEIDKGGSKVETDIQGQRPAAQEGEKRPHKKEHNKGRGKDEKKGKSAEKGGGRPVIYYVNPYTGEILGNSASLKSSAVNFMGYMFSLHRWLLLDKIEKPIFGELENRKLGSYITGTATIIFTLGVITGIAIWFPRKMKSWKQGLKVKWSGSWKRINHDLHNTLGFYSCIFLFLMGITGPLFSFSWYRDGLRMTLGTYKAEGKGEEKVLSSKLISGRTNRLTVTDYLTVANNIFDYSGDYSVNLPKDSAGTVNVMKYKNGFFAPSAADKLTLDQYSGKVLDVVKFSDLPFNERISGSLKSLHLGDVYGMFTKLIYFLACLIATSLPVTGTLIWLNKMKKKKKPMKALVI
ncbi:PepSY domain-containing protein [Pedobacter sp. PAMC26386]|nr:PepSY domain-containing protein [Pedobacter sp. PAMC26386]